MVLRSRVMRRIAALVFVLVIASIFGFWAAGGTAQAHGHTSVGDYSLVIGFHNEPAYQGEPNGLDLFVTNSKTNENVTGLSSTLKVEIIYGQSRKELELEPQWGREGAYIAYVLPTEAGNYTWHIFGSIKDTPVDVSMTSGPKTFGAVQPKSAVTFPGTEPSATELQQQIESANRLAVAALVVGIVGLLAGAGGVAYGMRNRNAAEGQARETRDEAATGV